VSFHRAASIRIFLMLAGTDVGMANGVVNLFLVPGVMSRRV
jgi:hypothetical protein